MSQLREDVIRAVASMCVLKGTSSEKDMDNFAEEYMSMYEKVYQHALKDPKFLGSPWYKHET